MQYIHDQKSNNKAYTYICRFINPGPLQVFRRAVYAN